MIRWILKPGPLMLAAAVLLALTAVQFTNRLSIPHGEIDRIIELSLPGVESVHHGEIDRAIELALQRPAGIRDAWVYSGFGGSQITGIVVLLCALAIGGFLWARSRRPKTARGAPDPEVQDATTPGTPAAVPKPRSGELRPHLAAQAEIERLFLEVYRSQVGASQQAPGEILPVADPKSGSPSIYELSIQMGENRMARRFTLRPIGGRTKGKSQCFFAIYDTQMVIKIPPAPIRNFPEYVEQLRREAAIQEKLHPKKCVTPNVSVIMRKIQPMTEIADMTTHQKEDHYIHMLDNDAPYRNYLKIGDSFVFFMDFSEYYFLSYVLERFHDLEREIETEIKNDIESIRGEDQFEDKYGIDLGRLWVDIRKLYGQFRAQMEGMLIESEDTADLSAHRSRELFHLVLAGQYQQKIESQPESGLEPILARLQKMVAENRPIADAYRRTMESYVARRAFNIHRLEMGELITNLLSLLSSLQERGIAIRDLKPDNLLVAGDPARYPHFLASAREYSIGLIDLETALDCQQDGKETPPEPQLGGTPLYATPSHFFENRTLAVFYSDLQRTLHMQDWHAMVAIIFEAVTGRNLFQRSARQVARIMRQVIRAQSETVDMPALYAKANETFWETALSEFTTQLHRERERMQSVRVTVPETVRLEIQAHAENVTGRLESRILRTVETHPLLKGSGVRDRLRNCSREELARMREKYLQGGEGQNRRPLLELLGELIRFKTRAEELTACSEKMSQPYPQVPADLLVEQMFSLVSSHMVPDSMLLGGPPAEAADTEEESPIEGLRYTFTLRVPPR